MGFDFNSYTCISRYDVTLRNAIKLGCTELATIAIAKGANINCQCPDDWNTPLHMAVDSGCESMVDLLMTHSPDYSSVNIKNITPSELAFRNGMSLIGRQLLIAEFGDHDPIDAFYEMLKRSSVQALEVLIGILNLPQRKLAECLAKAWSKLEVMNVQLEPELELFAHMTIIRSDYEQPIRIGSFRRITSQEVDQRMRLIMDGIGRLEQKYDTGLCNDVDDEFLDILRMLLRCLFTVKNQVEYFPVMHLEYCVAIYLAIFERKPDFDLFQLVISKYLIVLFLKQFKKAFEYSDKIDGRMSCEVLFDLTKVVKVNKLNKCKQTIHDWSPFIGTLFKTKEQVMIRNKIRESSLDAKIHADKYEELGSDEYNLLKTVAASINATFQLRKIRYRYKALFRVYFKLKQMYSLQKTIRYLAIVEKTELDPNRQCYVPILAIQRTLQVLGETLKSTKLSPNISTNLRSAIEFITPGNILNRITKLREFFSHEYSSTKHTLYKRLRENDTELIELYKRIQSDLRKMTPLLANIYSGQIKMYFKTFLGQVLQLNSVEKVQSFAKSCRVRYGFKVDFEVRTTDISEIGQLFLQLEQSYDPSMHGESLAIVSKISKMLKDHITLLDSHSTSTLTEIVISCIGCIMANENLDYQKNIARFFLANNSVPQNLDYGAKVLIMHIYNVHIHRLLVLESKNSDANSFARLNIIQKVIKLANAEEIDALYELSLGKDEFSLESTCNTIRSLQLDNFQSDLKKELDKLLAKYYSNLFAVDEKYRIVKQFCRRHNLQYNNERAALCRWQDLTDCQLMFNDLIQDIGRIVSIPSEMQISELVTMVSCWGNYHTDSPESFAVEIILLEVLEILSSRGILLDNRATMSFFRPVITGRNLRNYLAHDSLVYETICRNKNPHTTVMLNALCLSKYLKMNVFSRDEKPKHDGTVYPFFEIHQWISQAVEQKQDLFQSITCRRLSSFSSSSYDLKAREFHNRTVLGAVFDKHSEEFITFLLGRPSWLKAFMEALLRTAPNQLHNFYDDDEFTVRQLISSRVLRGNVNFYLALKHHHFDLEEELDKIYGGAYSEDSLYLALMFRNERSALSIIDHPRLYELCKKDASRYQRTILQVAALYKLPTVIRRICEVSPEMLECTDTAQETAMYHAISVGCKQSVEVLLEFGAKVHATSKSPIGHALKVRKDDIVDILLPSDAELINNEELLNQLVSDAGFTNHHVLLKQLIPQVQSSSTIVQSLHEASLMSNLEAMETILNQNKTLINDMSTVDRTPLLNACYGSSSRAVKLLLRYGADCSMPDDYPAVICAIEQNKRSFLKLFLQQDTINAKLREILFEKTLQPLKLTMAWEIFKAGYPCRVTECRSISRRLSEKRILKLMLKMCLSRPECVQQVDCFLTTHAILFNCQEFIENIFDAVFQRMNCLERARIINASIKAGDKETLNKCISRGCDVNCADSSGVTPLALAVSLGKPEMVRILIRTGADPNLFSTGNCDVIFTSWTLVGEDSFRQMDGHLFIIYPLIVATFHKHKKIAEFLLQNGASPDLFDPQGLPALCVAISCGDVECVRLLIDYGANVEYARQCTHLEFPGGNVLHAVAYYGHLEVLQMMVEEYNFDPTIKGSHGNTVLHIAVGNKQYRIVNYLLDSDYWFVPNQDGDTPFQLALRHFDEDIFQLIKAVPNSRELIHSFRDEQRRTVLHLAAVKGSISVIRSLLEEFDFDVDYPDQMGYTPIHYAVLHKKSEIVHLLLSTGASFSKREGQIPTAVLVALANQPDIVRLGIQTKSETVNMLRAIRIESSTLIHMSICKDNLPLCNLLLESDGYDIISHNEAGSTFLHLAAAVSSVRMVALLLHHGSRLDTIDKDGKSPLLVALEKGNLKVAHYLVAKGASKQAISEFKYKGNQGETLLHYVASEGNLDTLKFLIDQKFFSRVILDDNGKTIGHYAALFNRENVIEFLIATGFPVDYPDSEGRSTMACALQMGHLKLAKRLKTIGSSLKDVRSYNEKQSLLEKAIAENKLEIADFLSRECYVVNTQLSVPDQSSIELPKRSELVKPPLHVVIEQNKNDEIEQTINKHHLTLDELDSLGRAALHLSCIFNNFEATRKLVDLGATVDLQDNTQATPLIHCILNGYQPIADYLINAGASLEHVKQYRMPSVDQETVLHVVSRRGFTFVLDMLLKAAVFEIDVGDKDLTTALQDAAMYGQNECVNILLRHGADVNFVDSHATTALTRAISGGQEAVVNSLLEHGVNLDNSRLYRLDGGNEESLLHFLLFANLKPNLKLIETLIHLVEIDANVVDKHGQTPLHYASMMGLEEAVRCLLQHGASVDAVDHHGKTPLVVAVLTGQIETAKILLREKNIIPYLERFRFPGSEKTILHVTYDKKLYQLLELLLKTYKVDSTMIDAEGRTVLHHAATDGNILVVKLFCSQPELFFVKDISGNTPLSVSVKQCNIDVLDVILNSVIEPTEFTHLTSILEYIVKFDSQQVLQYYGKWLLDNRINYVAGNQQINKLLDSFYGMKATDAVIMNNDIDLLQLLLASTFDKTIKQNSDILPHGTSWLHFAALKNFDKLSVIVTRQGNVPVDSVDKAQCTPLVYAAFLGHLETAKVLLESGANVNHADVNHRTPLLSALEENRTDMVQLLLAHGASIALVQDFRYTNDNRFTVMHFLAERGHCAALSLVISSMDVNCVDIYGMTPLHYAASCNQLDMINLLQRAGAAIDWVDKNGATALIRAAAKGHVQAYERLLEHGANVHLIKPFRNSKYDNESILHVTAEKGRVAMTKILVEDLQLQVDSLDSEGNTPLHWAVKKGSFGVVRYLISKHANIHAKDNAGATVLQLLESIECDITVNDSN